MCIQCGCYWQWADIRGSGPGGRDGVSNVDPEGSLLNISQQKRVQSLQSEDGNLLSPTRFQNYPKSIPGKRGLIHSVHINRLSIFRAYLING